jgi:DNA-binding MarR family transcriptional regulator
MICYRVDMAASDTREIPTDRLMRSALSGDVSFLLARANAVSLAAGNAALAAHGLKARSYSVLALAADDTRPSQRELAEFLRLDPSQVVALVDDLQRRGLVERQPDPTDRRANVVVATDAGRELFAQAQADARGAEQRVHGNLTPEQRAQLAELLRLTAFVE